MSIAIKHPAIRYHGGKFRLATWIIGHFPAHRCYGGIEGEVLFEEAAQ